MAKVDVSSLSDEELEQAWDEAAQKALTAKEYAKSLGDEFHRRVETKAAEEKVAAMNDAERAALAQALTVKGIASEESVNG